MAALTTELLGSTSPNVPDGPDGSEDMFVYGVGRWQYDSKVIDWLEERKPENYRRGITLYKDVARMDDGNDYQVHTFMPSRQKTEVPVVFTSAWLTSDGGHNRHTALKTAELGFPVVLVGPEGNYREPFLEWAGRLALHGSDVWRELRQIRMSRTAHNIHQILDANGGHYFYDSSQIVLLGESRGAMVGMGEEAFAENHSRNVVYADLVAPCFAEAFDMANAIESMKYPQQGLHELKAIGKVVTKATLSRLAHYPDTFNLSPKSMLYHAFTAGTLFSGEAGEMAHYIPLDRNMHIRAFKGDHAGQAIQWERIFGHHQAVVVNNGEGSHLSIADPDTLYEILGRLTHLRSELERTGDNATDIDYELVHLRPQLRSVA